MPRRSTSSSPKPAELTLDKMRGAIPQLQKRIIETRALNAGNLTDAGDPAIRTLEQAIDRTLVSIFGNDTAEYERYREAAQIGPLACGMSRTGTPADLPEFVGRHLNSSGAILQGIVQGFEEEIAAQESEATPEMPGRVAVSNRIFVVHGRDEAARESVARFISQIGLEPIILHERANKGRTLITKFREESADIGFAVVLMTPDDHGAQAGESATQPRARQNVVFELGFFTGALGPERVAALVKGNIERPSDFDGVVYIDLDDAGGWKLTLARELEAAGFEIDSAKLMRS